MSKFLLVNGDVKREIILSDQLKQTLKNLFDELNIDEEKDIDINPHLISLIMNYSLINKYSYTNGLTIDKILNETVSIPIFEWILFNFKVK